METTVRKTLGLTFLGLLSMILIHCGDDHDGDQEVNANPNYACLQQPDGACESFPYYDQYNVYRYPQIQAGYIRENPYQRFRSGFCCGYARKPIYHPRWGLMCVDASSWQNGPLYSWSFEGNNSGILGSGCTWDLGRACNPSDPYACTSGYCQQTAPGAMIGICTNPR